MTFPERGNSINSNIIRQIARAAGPGNCLDSKEDRACYSYDSAMKRDIPALVVLPEKSSQVSEIMKICHANAIPVWPRGAGSGTAGASVPGSSGIVMSMSRFNRIISISPDNLQAVVEPGVVTGVLQQQVERHGLFYPPDPASLSFCTIGGNVSTGAGGARAVKYGVTRDHVISLEVCLADGTIINTGSATAKGVAGYDLTRLFIGSEGTLGIVTRVTLRLVPMPEACGTITGFFPDMASAAKSVGCLFRNRLLPRCAEFLDEKSLVCASEKLPLPLPEDAKAMLLVEVDGPETSIATQLETVTGCFQINGVLSTFRARTPEEAASIWAARRAVSPAMKKLGFRHKINEDICVPRSALPEMINRLETIEKRHGLCIVTFGHAGDGNLHVNVMHNGEDRNGFAPANAAVNEIMRSAVELGGTISGEHGIGLAKRPFMEIEFPETALEIMRGIKRAFDPLDILNPGKVLP